MSGTLGYGGRRRELGAANEPAGGSQSMCSKLTITHKATRAPSGHRSGGRALIGGQSSYGLSVVLGCRVSGMIGSSAARPRAPASAPPRLCQVGDHRVVVVSHVVLGDLVRRGDPHAVE